jgi:hypothetical protein
MKQAKGARSGNPGADRRATAAWPIAGLIAVLMAAPLAAQPAEPPPAAPKSLLPDVFDGPAIDSDPRPAPVAPLPGVATAAPAPLAGTLPAETGPALAGATPAPDPFALASRHDGNAYGPLTPENGGFGPAAFAGSKGMFIAGLGRRMATPIGSRWVAITLRRALLSQSATPPDIVPGDWVAARASLLLRNGEIDGAKAMVDGIAVDRYSPGLYKVAAQVALAAGDLGGLCPIAVTGRSLFADVMWQMAVGMCAALQGDDITAARIFDDLRADAEDAEPFDVRLGERVATLAGGAGRASNVEWSEAPGINLFRYGIATAAGVPVPADLLPGLGAARFGWLVRSPGVSPEIRLASLRPAAVLGSVSADELVSGITALSPGDAAADTPAGRLRTAFAGASLANRLAAMKAIWASAGDAGDDGGNAADRYGALIESGNAAARLPIGAAAADASADIIAALLAVGQVDAARRWWPVADQAGGKVRTTAWALLAAGAGGVPMDSDEFKTWRTQSGADDRKAALLLAALAGQGQAQGSGWAGLRDELLPRAANSWTRAITAAAAAGRSGEVAVLAASGVQGALIDLPPLHLYHIVAALVRTGHAAEARLIAAEAMTRG